MGPVEADGGRAVGAVEVVIVRSLWPQGCRIKPKAKLINSEPRRGVK